MNKDVKIGLAIGLLLLVVLFVVIAFKSGDRPTGEAEPGTTTSTDGTGESSPAAEYFTTPETTTDTVILDLGGDPGVDETVKAEELSPEAQYYLKQLQGEPSTDTTITPEPPPVVVTPPTYVVKPGDFLSTISQKVYGTARHWERIAQANDIDDPTLLRPGMVLTIPPLSEVAPLRVGEPTAAFDPGEQTHTVVEGDTLSDISKTYYGTVRYMQLIKETNRLDSDDLLRVGSVLRIPKVTSGPAGVSPAPVAGETYVVQEGDTLGSISQRFYGTARLYTLIMQANGIDDARRLPVGRPLVIPPRPGGGAPVPTPPRDPGQPRLKPGENRYVVQYGDTLSEIADSELGSSRYYIYLMRRNNIHTGESLREGQVIIIPNRHSLNILSTEARDR